MGNQKRGPGVLLLAVICVVFFWIVGATMIALQGLGIIHIAKWILALPFWVPYTAFNLVLAIMLLRNIFDKKINDK